MIDLSTVIITLNEEANIDKCIRSIHDISDEIIVIDSFSTDRTREICEGFNVQFYQKKFVDYSDQKNYGIHLAKCKYILSIDADEELSQELKQSILRIKQKPQYDAYKFNRLNNYCGKWIYHCGWYPDDQVRLWKQGKGIWHGAVHEKLLIDSDEIGRLNGDLLHYTYHSIHQHVQKINQYTTLIAKMKYEEGTKYSLVKLVIGPPITFIKKYIFQFGILDGYLGFIICSMSAYYAYLKYVKLKELEEGQKG